MKPQENARGCRPLIPELPRKTCACATVYQHFFSADLVCSSFRLAAVAALLRKSLRNHTAERQRPREANQIESHRESSLHSASRSLCRKRTMKRVAGEARARFPTAFARSKAVPSETASPVRSASIRRCGATIRSVKRWGCRSLKRHGSRPAA